MTNSAQNLHIQQYFFYRKPSEIPEDKIDDISQQSSVGWWFSIHLLSDNNNNLGPSKVYQI